MTERIIHGRASAFNVQKVLWLADELSLDYAHVPVGGAHGGLDDPAFRELNPHGKVPVLVDRGHAIWESHTILRYLANVSNEDTIYPTDPLSRSQVERWMDWSLAAFQPDFMRLFWGFYRCPPEQRDTAAIAAARRDCAARFETLAAVLSDRYWLAGDSFTLADIPAATALYRYTTMGADVTLPAPVADWYARLAERTAYRNRIMVDYSALAGRVDF